MHYTFDSEIASKVGVNAAVLYHNIQFWCDKNRANNKHFYDGRYWTYNSNKAFDEMFDFLSSKQIRTALEKLELHGFIIKANYNKSTYDRTCWFSNMHMPKKANGFGQKGEPIPDSKPDSKPDRKYIKEFEELKEAYKKAGNTKDIIGSMNKAETKYISLLSKKEAKHDTVISSLIAYDKYLKKEAWQKKQHLITFLNQKSWETYTFTEEKILTLHEAREQSYRNTGFWKDEWGNKPVGDNK